MVTKSKHSLEVAELVCKILLCVIFKNELFETVSHSVHVHVVVSINLNSSILELLAIYSRCKSFALLHDAGH